jgi:hypothetical protein
LWLGVTNFADEIAGNVPVAVLPAQFRGDLLGPVTLDRKFKSPWTGPTSEPPGLSRRITRPLL